ncbi:MAG: exodeoxyribonuclease V subunit alpha [Candidatus Zhuqueibacterota bacterium]
MMNSDIRALFNQSKFSRLDIHFASFMVELSRGKSDELALAAALVSYHTRQGHICLDLATMAGKKLAQMDDAAAPVFCPELADWRSALLRSEVVGAPGQFTPLILDGKNRLYLYRYWDYENALITAIQARVNAPVELESRNLPAALATYFPDDNADEPDWQRIAGFVSLAQKFVVISGGPGTGKTTTVAKILALLIQTSRSGLNIALAAPTGKAAARLQEAIQSARQKLNCPEYVKQAIPEKTSTIHRLLAPRADSPYFRFNEKNPLAVDVVVVDESSMVDLALMAKLVRALPADARLILLGDKNQLASVEAGAVLGDVCDAGRPHSFTASFRERLKREAEIHSPEAGETADSHPIQNCIVQFQKSYRFKSDSGIAAVSRAIHAGDSVAAFVTLSHPDRDDIRWQGLPRPDALLSSVREKVTGFYGQFREVIEPEQAFRLFERFCILCALREGPYGVVSLNAMIESALRENHLISGENVWYPGRPVLVTTNDYQLRLYNGDVGFAFSDPASNGELRVFFPALDGAIRKYHPMRLPAHETVYAMTIHKSQGSEFDEVLVILPERDSPLLTRELVYTAITRARLRAEIWTPESVFKTAVSRRISRSSGLRDSLWQ